MENRNDATVGYNSLRSVRAMLPSVTLPRNSDVSDVHWGQGNRCQPQPVLCPQVSKIKGVDQSGSPLDPDVSAGAQATRRQGALLLHLLLPLRLHYIVHTYCYRNNLQHSV